MSAALDALADRVDRDPRTYRFSYHRDFGDIRLIVVDSRCARDLTPTARALVDSTEWEWLDEQLQGGFRHLLLATSLPFLLPIGLHHVESWDEAISQGAWGRFAARIGERLRQMVDLEHWAAWQNSFQSLARILTETADGERGAAPDSLLILSGDVHFSYIAEVERSGGGRIVQAVCSPVRNPLPRLMRWFSVVMSYGLARPVGAVVARSAKVPDPPFEWTTTKGPWFDNNLVGAPGHPRGPRADLAQGRRRQRRRTASAHRGSLAGRRRRPRVRGPNQFEASFLSSGIASGRERQAFGAEASRHPAVEPLVGEVPRVRA